MITIKQQNVNKVIEDNMILNHYPLIRGINEEKPNVQFPTKHNKQI